MASSISDDPSQVPQSTAADYIAMTLVQRRFFASEQCTVARRALQRLVDNPQYNTDSNYFKTSGLPFVDRHLHYLSMHPIVNLEGYISNLKLMTSVKQRK